ncbi:hypothetical protein CHS0354_029393 [Potamilus streckersoni]|uniref:TRAF1-6 MATH domain-containing protein n=1 Tax=Potamilus streckersoni TaxID=2493646 RepID=A0AAE0W2A4_9BIVA|nr:hypothetical protein CHS0354_029393 [Potamilus streckersoni]
MANFQGPNIAHDIPRSAPGKQVEISQIIIIQEYDKMRQRALKDMFFSIQSDPLYVFNGAKVRVKIYLNGDEIGGERCMTVFFVIMKGVYDADLIWPFDGIVVLEIFNKETSEFEMVDSFVSDPASVCFKKPSTNRNIGQSFADLQSLLEFDGILKLNQELRNILLLQLHQDNHVS